MKSNLFFVMILLLLVIVVPLVSADLQVVPNNPVISTQWYNSSTFSMSLKNTNNFSIYNLQFSPTQYFTFPPSVNLSVNETKVIGYGISTNQLFSNQIFVSTISYFYIVPFTPTSKTIDVNITANGFQPTNIVIRQNDSVNWHNQLTQSVDVRDLGTGFGQVTIGALGNQIVNYPTIANFNFYASPLGFSGNLKILEKLNTTFEHSSQLDKQVQFTLSSILAPSTMQVNQLTGTITASQNVTYPDVLIEIRNGDANLLIQNISLSGSLINGENWISSNFSPNNFNLQPNSPQRILFNLTPIIHTTNQSNQTYNLILNITSNNAGSTTKSIPIFVNYINMDNVMINGTQYIIHMLSINETASACKQHRIGVGNYDPGFELCAYLEVQVNQTIIKTVEANYLFSEGTVKQIQNSMIETGNVSDRLENKMNFYVDKQNSIDEELHNLSVHIVATDNFINQTLTKQDRVLQNQNRRFWVVFSVVFVLFLCGLSLWLADNISFFNAMEKGGQI